VIYAGWIRDSHRTGSSGLGSRTGRPYNRGYSLYLSDILHFFSISTGSSYRMIWTRPTLNRNKGRRMPNSIFKHLLSVQLNVQPAWKAIFYFKRLTKTRNARNGGVEKKVAYLTMFKGKKKGYRFLPPYSSSSFIQQPERIFTHLRNRHHRSSKRNSASLGPSKNTFQLCMLTDNSRSISKEKSRRSTSLEAALYDTLEECVWQRMLSIGRNLVPFSTEPLLPYVKERFPIFSLLRLLTRAGAEASPLSLL